MLDAYTAAVESAAVFDLGDRAMIELAGRDAREFLHNLCTQDVKSLPVGASREAFLTTTKARVIAHLWIWHRRENILLLDFAACQGAKVLEHLNRHLISEQVEISGLTGTYSLLRVLGPQAAAMLTSVGLVPTRPQPLAGFQGCDQFLPDEDGDAGVLGERLLEAGAITGDAGTYDVLRIEAGMPEFGIDIDEDRLAMEVNRPQAISYTKGCYLGQETIVMARDRGQVNRKLMGIQFHSQHQPGAPATGEPGVAPSLALRVGGTKLYVGKDEVGTVTSSAFSPRLQSEIGLAYLRRGSSEVGTQIALTPEGPAAAVVCALPFTSRT